MVIWTKNNSLGSDSKFLVIQKYTSRLDKFKWKTTLSWELQLENGYTKLS